VFLAGTSSDVTGVVEIDEFAVFPLPYLRKILRFRNNVGINCTLYDNAPFWIPAGTNKDDLE